MISLFFVGVAMAVAGNTLIACSLTLQKHVHNRAATSGKPVAKSALFWLALVGMIAGEVGNFAAFGFASPTVVSPLGATAVIVNAVLAVFFLREAFFLRSLLGMLLIVGGSVVVVLFSPPSVDKLSIHEFIMLVQQPSAIVYLACVAGAIVVLALLEPRFGQRWLLVNLGLCSLLGSITVLCSSSVSKFLKAIGEGDDTLLRSPLPYALVPLLATTAVLQLRFLNRAMAAFDSTRVVPVYYITFTLASITGGGVFFRDFWRFSATRAAGFGGGCVLCFGGVYLVSRRPRVVRPDAALVPLTDDDAERDRLRLSGPSRSHRLSSLLTSSLDEVLGGGHEEVENSVRRTLDPPVAGVTGLGTMTILSTRAASERFGSPRPSVVVSPRDNVAPVVDSGRSLSEGLLEGQVHVQAE